MDNYSNLIPILRDMKKLHLDIETRRRIFRHPEIVANMISNILSFPEPVKDLYMSALGLWNGKIQSFKEKIGRIEFFQSYDLLKSLELFFEFQYGVEVGIYVMHEEWDGELLIGNRNTHKRDLHLKNGTEHLDYVVEKKCMESNNFEVGNGIVGNGGKGAIRIDTMDGKTYILSFGNIASDSKKIFHIQQGFEKGGFEQIIKTKLEHINKIYKDALTKLYNREYFNQVAQLHSYSFLFIDINNFKLVNDNFWHLIGDQVLIEVAKIVEESIRKNDKACRLWWDEFLLLVDTNEEETMENIAIMLQTKFHSNEFIRIYNRRVWGKLGLAVGWDLFESGTSTDDRFRVADQRMYRNKLVFDQYVEPVPIVSTENIEMNFEVPSLQELASEWEALEILEWPPHIRHAYEMSGVTSERIPSGWIVS